MAEQNPTPQETDNSLAKDISFIQRFIDEHFSQMHWTIRSITYLSLLFLFGYAFLSAITMNVIYELKIDKASDEDSQRPDIYLVDFDFTQTFLVDTDRTYKLAVPFTKSLAIKWDQGLKGNMAVRVKNGETFIGQWNKEVEFKADGIKNKFKPLTITYTQDSQGDSIPNVAQAEINKKLSNHQISIISTANAGDNHKIANKNPSLISGRIYVEKIEASKDYDQYDININALVNDVNILQLMSRETRSASYSLSVTPGSVKYFYGRYYFDLPTGGLSSLKLVSETTGSLPFFKNKSTKEIESLNSLSYDKPFEVTFDNKVKLKLRFANPYELVYFKVTGNESDLINSLRESAQKEGFYLFDVPSIRGQKSNAIFASNLIPFDMIKKVIRYAKDNHIKLNSIQCTSNLKTAAKNQIQIGYSPKYTKQKADDVLEKYLKANSNEEFRALCDKP